MRLISLSDNTKQWGWKGKGETLNNDEICPNGYVCTAATDENIRSFHAIYTHHNSKQGNSAPVGDLSISMTNNDSM